MNKNNLPEFSSIQDQLKSLGFVPNINIYKTMFTNRTSMLYFFSPLLYTSGSHYCSQLVRIGNQLLGLETPLQWEMTFQLKSQQPDMPEV